MSDNYPQVSIGLPVFNGENFLAESLDSLLTQTHTDFEIIISDNGSTDRTQDICQAYAAKDSRVRYFRHEQNVGAAKNFNFTFEMATGEYFKWASHDDVCQPQFLERCVEVLDADNSIVLCYPKTVIIDAHGNPMLNYVVQMDTAGEKTHQRLRNMIGTEHWSYQVFGLFRASSLMATSLIGNYADSDMVLLVETCLIGRVYEIPEYLFLRREHPETSTNKYKTQEERMAWFDPTQVDKKHFPMWLKFRNYFLAIKGAPISRIEQGLCYAHLARWVMDKMFLRLARKLHFRLDRSHIAVPVEGAEWR